jgi:hypothetical protein
LALLFPKNSVHLIKNMAEAFSYFTYNNNNLERSFLSSLSQILQESRHENPDRQIELVEDDSQVEDQQSGNEDENSVLLSFLKQQDDDDENRSDKSDDDSTVNEEDAKEEGSSDSGSSSESESQQDQNESEDTDFFVELLSNKFENNPPQQQKKSAKVVPLPAPPSTKKRVQFTPGKKMGAKETKNTDEEVSDSESEDVKEVNIQENESTDNNELEALVKQLVLLENESSKAQQFLNFIQQHNCFDKQDHKAVHHFMELIEQEKNSLVLVLSNYSPQIQPLITMMTIAERRLSLLDSTPFITPGSTLHATFLEKQRMLQNVIEEATSHVYG